MSVPSCHEQAVVVCPPAGAAAGPLTRAERGTGGPVRGLVPRVLRRLIPRPVDKPLGGWYTFCRPGAALPEVGPCDLKR